MSAPSEASHVILLQVLSGGRRNGELFFLGHDSLLLGRRQQEPPADVLFSAEDSVVSNRHASLRRDGDGYVLQDEGSKFGTFILAHDNLGLPEGALPRGARLTEPLHLPTGAVIGLQLGGGGPICRLLVGRAIPFGRYLLVGRLGEGGMGAVYLAWEVALGRLVVLKWVKGSLLASASDAENMLRDEAAIGAKLDHSHAAGVYDVNREGGVLYIAMEYLRGMALSELQRQLGRLNQRLPPDLAAALVRQACLGLHAAHQAQSPAGRPLNIVHRDVSPSNIMCTHEGTIKVIDFGVARARGRLNETLSGTLSGHGQNSANARVVGNPAYMSPEHITAPSSVDHHSDIFSVGVVLYELCTGKRLFYRPDNVDETMNAVLRCEVPDLRERCPEASETLARAVQKALSLAPIDRQRSAQELARQLQQVELEAGGRFMDREAIVRYLTDCGVQLLGRLPVPLREFPDELGPPTERISAQTGPRQPPLASLLEPGQTIGAERYRLGTRLSPARALSRRPIFQVFYLVESLVKGITAPGDHLVAAIYGGASDDRPYPLPDAEANRFFAFAERGRMAPAEGHLPLVLDHGVCWKDGPSFLIMPHHALTLAGALVGALSPEERLRLGLLIAAALAALAAADPAYVHGRLDPSHVALSPERGPATRAVLLGSSLHWVLGLPNLAEAGEVHGSPYAAPEVGARRTLTPAADVYALGMILYQLAGGNVAAAAQAVAAGQPPPPLSSRRSGDVPSWFAAAAFLALRRDPTDRPDAAELLRRLAPPVALGADEDLTLNLPLSGEVALETRARLRVIARQIHLDPWLDREPQPSLLPLPLPPASGCGPETLWVHLNDQILDLRIQAEARRGRRLELYRDPPGPGTHVHRFELPFLASDGKLYVGHHRGELARLDFACRSGGDEDLVLRLPELGLSLHLPAQAPGQRLCAVWVMDPAGGIAHLLIITVGSRA